jgi:hypothetical protein
MADRSRSPGRRSREDRRLLRVSFRLHHDVATALRAAPFTTLYRVVGNMGWPLGLQVPARHTDAIYWQEGNWLQVRWYPTAVAVSSQVLNAAPHVRSHVYATYSVPSSSATWRERKLNWIVAQETAQNRHYHMWTWRATTNVIYTLQDFGMPALHGMLCRLTVTSVLPSHIGMWMRCVPFALVFDPSSE